MTTDQTTTDLDLARLLQISVSTAKYDVTNDVRREKDFGALERARLVDVSHEHDTMSSLHVVLLTLKGQAVVDAMLAAARKTIEQCQNT